MKALTVRQPYAGLIAAGRKTIELRTWSTDYRGPLAICAATKPADHPVSVPGDLVDLTSLFGVLVAVVQLVDVRPYLPSDAPGTCVDPARLVGRTGFSWVLATPQQVRSPRPVRGMPGLFNLPAK